MFVPKRLLYCPFLSTSNVCLRFSSQDTKSTKINIPKRIERGPTDILQALRSTVNRDITAAHYKYHDDPYLIPQSNVGKRTFALSQEAGRKAAKWIVQEHSDLFQHKVAEPFIQAFSPKVVYNEESNVAEETLLEVIDSGLVTDAIIIYELLQNKNIDISSSTKQSLLELLCFHNAEDSLPEEWIEERWFRQGNKGGRERFRKTWKDHDIVDKIFKSIENPPAAAYSSLIQGMIKYFQMERAWQLYEETQNKQIMLDTNCYNALIRATAFLREGHDLKWKLVEDLLHAMVRQHIAPNLGTLNSVMQIISTIIYMKQAAELAFSTLTEFKEVGIDPSLGTYYYLLITLCREKGPTYPVLYDIMDEIQGKEFTIRDSKDTFFFVTAMDVCRNHLHDKELALKVDQLLHTGNNYNLIGDSFKESIYYRHFFMLMCATEPIDEFMKLYNKLVPNIYTPEPSIMEELMKTINMNGAVEYWPQIWSDMLMFDHADRENLLSLLLDSLVSHQPADDDTKQNETFAKIAWEVWEKIEKQPEHRTNKISWSGRMVSNVLMLCTRANDIEKANTVFQKLDKHQHEIVGEASIEALCSYFDLLVANQLLSRALKCVEYCSEIGFPEAESMCQQIQTKFNLNEEEQSRLNLIRGEK